MIDPHILAEQPELVKAHLRRRRADPATLRDVDEIAASDAERRRLIAERDTLRAERNRTSRAIGGLYKEGRVEEAERAKAEVQAVNARIKAVEEALDALQRDIEARALRLPNLLHDSVPDGDGEQDNAVLRTWGTPPAFDFEPRDHVDLGTSLGILDLERAAKLAGARFYLLYGAGARLERALISFFLDLHTRAHGYTEVLPPYIVWEDCALGTAQLPKFGHDMFKIDGQVNGHDAYLVPTAEVPVTNIHREEILDAAALPRKFAAFTPCFRSEAGSAGRDTRGIIRVHQFHKVELVWITTPERALDDHAALVRHAETALERLELPYRTVSLCSADIGFAAGLCHDIEVWLPSQGRYREISSCSWFGDFQARRMHLRYRPEPVDGRKQKPRLAHTLNGSGLAVGRTLVAILENYQQPDGSVVIPEALRPYMGGQERIAPPAGP